MKTLKYSRQRESVKNFLTSCTNHPTADMVYENMRKEFPNISLGTVYRNLNLLVELGEAVKITTKSGSDRFDARMTPHYHFICNTCGSVKDLLIDPIKDLETHAANHINEDVNHHEINFFGTCQTCKNFI